MTLDFRNGCRKEGQGSSNPCIRILLWEVRSCFAFFCFKSVHLFKGYDPVGNNSPLKKADL